MIKFIFWCCFVLKNFFFVAASVLHAFYLFIFVLVIIVFSTNEERSLIKKNYKIDLVFFLLSFYIFAYLYISS